MKTLKILLVLLIIGISSESYARSPEEKTGSLLWKISGKDLNKPSYILGTYHLMSYKMLDSIPGANEALNSCEQVVGEVDMNNMDGIITATQSAGTMPSDTTYQMLYTPEDYQFVDKQVMELMGAGLDQLKTIKPVMIDMVIAVMIAQKYIPDYDPTDSLLDLYIQEEAQKANKVIIGLESEKEQLNILFSKSLQRQADLLLCNLQNIQETTKTSRQVIEDYLSADLTGLNNSFEDKSAPCQGTKEEDDALLSDRNNNWIRQLPEIMKNKSSLIAVGCLHLVGESGLLNQLEKAGYTVEAVKK